MFNSINKYFIRLSPNQIELRELLAPQQWSNTTTTWKIAQVMRKMKQKRRRKMYKPSTINGSIKKGKYSR